MTRSCRTSRPICAPARSSSATASQANGPWRKTTGSPAPRSAKPSGSWTRWACCAAPSAPDPPPGPSSSRIPPQACPPPCACMWQAAGCPSRTSCRPVSCSRPGPPRPGLQRGGTEEELKQAAALLDAMDNPGIDRATFHELDARFHVALSSFFGNATVATMMESLSGAIVGYVKGAMDAMESWPDVLCELRSQHHGIFDAVQAHDGELLARRLREHI